MDLYLFFYIRLGPYSCVTQYLFLTGAFFEFGTLDNGISSSDCYEFSIGFPLNYFLLCL